MTVLRRNSLRRRSLWGFIKLNAPGAGEIKTNVWCCNPELLQANQISASI